MGYTVRVRNVAGSPVVVTIHAGAAGKDGSSGGGGGAGVVFSETPSGSVNGSNATFTTLNDFVPGSVSVRVNGLSQRPGTDFTTSGVRTIALTSSPTPGESIQVDYTRG
jgi:hypothetical protein